MGSSSDPTDASAGSENSVNSPLASLTGFGFMSSPSSTANSDNKNAHHHQITNENKNVIRIMLRLLLDGVECFAGSAELPLRHPAKLSELALVLKEVFQICRTCLHFPKHMRKVSTHVRINSYAVYVLQRLSAIKLQCHPQASPSIVKALQSLSDTLQPFAIVPAATFFTNVPNQVSPLSLSLSRIPFSDHSPSRAHCDVC